MDLQPPRRLEPRADAEDLDRPLDALVDRRRRHPDDRCDLLGIVMREDEAQTGALGFGELIDASPGHATAIRVNRSGYIISMVLRLPRSRRLHGAIGEPPRADIGGGRWWTGYPPRWTLCPAENLASS